jgi:hypothetical protein
MRKGILSLSMPSRGKTPGKQKTANMELAEQSTIKIASVEEPVQEAETQEKPFVQTVMVPKALQAPRNVKRKHNETSRRIHYHQDDNL